ncbi:hypothetical protein BpHYR1_028280 [Brachionus plicatilis]|uniref:Uncharacterized protein n=1 Tax=Brachionus plicatilis TaxID=10195 RepID=A0A3M7Q858_BRAPC|nr:hypothetical protein BpHYR1_028280 [Brachionus plicatilis]
MLKIVFLRSIFLFLYSAPNYKETLELAEKNTSDLPLSSGALYHLFTKLSTTISLKFPSNFPKLFDKLNYVRWLIVYGNRCFNWEMVTSHILSFSVSVSSNFIFQI